MKIRAILTRERLHSLAWLLIPGSIVLGDVVIRWNKSIPESAFYDPSLAFSFVLGMFFWWSVSRLVGSSPKPRLWATLVSVPTAILLVVAWRFRQYTFHDPSVGILVYAYREPHNAAQFVPHGFSPGLVIGVLCLIGLWTVALTRCRPKLTPMSQRLCMAMPVLWVLAGLTLPPGTPGHGSPYLSDLHLTQIFGETAKRIVYGDAGAILGIPSAPLPIPTVTKAERPNVIIFVAESLRRDRLGIFGHDRDTTPHMARFFEAHREEVFTFSRAYTASPYSPLAMSSALTGLAPARSQEEVHKMPLLWSYAQAYGGTSFLATPQDWGVQGLSDFFLITAPPEKVITAASFQSPIVNDTGIHDAIVARRTADMLRRELPPDQPFIGVIVTNASHFPFLMAEDVPWEINDIRDRYDGSVRLIDEFFHEVLLALEDTGRMDETIFIFTADHGEYFYNLRAGEHEDDKRVYDLWSDGLRVQSCHPVIASVPFWMYVPDKWLKRLGVSSDMLRANQASSISNLDIVPTVLEVLGLQDLPLAEGYPRFDGQSLFKPMPVDRTVPCFTSASWVSWMPAGFAIFNREHAVYGRADFLRFEAYDLSDERVFSESVRGAPLSDELREWLVHVSETDPNVGDYFERLTGHRSGPAAPQTR